MSEAVSDDRSMITKDDPCIAAGHCALDAYWDSIGRSERDLISYVVNPQFQGKPPWPAAIRERNEERAHAAASSPH
jgi:hypothetical protein